MLEVSGINAGYGAAQALWDVDLGVEDGEIVTILGPNGAGKTTLVNVIAGIQPATRGQVLLNGVDLTEIKPHQVGEHGVALVPEGRRIFPSMDVADNLEIGAYGRHAREHAEETRDRVYEIFPRLEERSRQLAGSLSGDEQQMLAIGRALMAQTSLLLLDEPSLGLAPIVVQSIFAVLADINESGVSILLVEQNAVDAQELASRAYVLEEGRMAAQGGAGEIMDDDRLRRAYLGL